MALLSGFHRRIEQEAFAKEAVASMGMRIEDRFSPGTPIDELHVNGQVVSCTFVRASQAGPTCPFEEQCDGNCLLIVEES